MPNPPLVLYTSCLISTKDPSTRRAHHYSSNASQNPFGNVRPRPGTKSGLSYCPRIVRAFIVSGRSSIDPSIKTTSSQLKDTASTEFFCPGSKSISCPVTLSVGISCRDQMRRCGQPGPASLGVENTSSRHRVLWICIVLPECRKSLVELYERMRTDLSLSKVYAKRGGAIPNIARVTSLFKTI